MRVSLLRASCQNPKNKDRTLKSTNFQNKTMEDLLLKDEQVN